MIGWKNWCLSMNRPRYLSIRPTQTSGVKLRFLTADREGFLAFIAQDALGVDPERAAEDEDTLALIADGLQTPEHIAIITGVEGLATDLSDSARVYERSGKPLLFFAKAEWAKQAERWVRANLPLAEFAQIPVHAGFLTAPGDFNARLSQFLEQV